MMPIFVAAKGVEACLALLVGGDFANQEVLLLSLALEGTGAAEKAVWDFGIHKIHSRII